MPTFTISDAVPATPGLARLPDRNECSARPANPPSASHRETFRQHPQSAGVLPLLHTLCMLPRFPAFAVAEAGRESLLDQPALSAVELTLNR